MTSVLIDILSENHPERTHNFSTDLPIGQWHITFDEAKALRIHRGSGSTERWANGGDQWFLSEANELEYEEFATSIQPLASCSSSCSSRICHHQHPATGFLRPRDQAVLPLQQLPRPSPPTRATTARHHLLPETPPLPPAQVPSMRLRRSPSRCAADIDAARRSPIVTGPGRDPIMTGP